MKTIDVAICGATGAVGREIPDILKNLDVPVNNLSLYGSERSAGRIIETPFGRIEISKFVADQVGRTHDIVFLCVGGDFSKAHARNLAKQAVVIDNSSAFRYEDDVPLVVPGVNSEAIGNSNLIANPNCTTAILMKPLAPLVKRYGVKRVIVSSYQAASGAGAEGMQELEAGIAAMAAGETIKAEKFAHPLAGNVIPMIDKPQDNGYSKEEMKIAWETRKILGLPETIKIGATAVRVPTMRSHAEAVTVETNQNVKLKNLRAIWSEVPGLEVVDSPAADKYPMPINTTGKYPVEVGRLRQSEAFDNGVDFFVCGDQVLRGAALNAAEIAEIIYNQRFR